MAASFFGAVGVELEDAAIGAVNLLESADGGMTWSSIGSYPANKGGLELARRVARLLNEDVIRSATAELGPIPDQLPGDFGEAG